MKSFSTGLFIDDLGGLPLNQIVTICGPAGSGKTLLSLILAMRFLYNFFDATAIFIDPENMVSKYDLRKICERNGIPEFTLNNLKIANPVSVNLAIKSIHNVLESVESSHILVVIDPLPSLFLNQPFSSDKVTSKRNKKSLAEEIYGFLDSLTDVLKKRGDYILIIVDQTRALPKNRRIPEFWKREKLVPALWNVLQIFTDTLILLKKIRRRLILLRIVYSKFLPEVMGLLQIGRDILI